MGTRGRLDGRDLEPDRLFTEGLLLAVVKEIQRFALEQVIGGLVAGHRDPQQPPAEPHVEGQPRDAVRQARAEGQRVLHVPHAAESGHERYPRPGQRGHMHAVAGIALHVPQVHERRLGEVFMGQLELPDLRRDHRLRARRQRRVAYGQRLVIGEVTLLLFGGKRIAAHLYGQHKIGLLDDLLPVQVEVGVVQEQRVVLLRGVLEVPDRVLGEALVLGMHAQALVIGNQHGARRVPPLGRLFVGHPEVPREVLVPFHHVSGGRHVSLGHQVGENVVVFHRAVLVGPGHAVDAEPALGVVMADAPPQPGRLHQQLDSDFALELLVPGGVDVVDDRVRDVRVDVKRGGASRPVPGALLAVDGPPRERRAPQSQVGGAFAGHGQDRMTPAQDVGGGRRLRVGQHRQDERLGVPERVPVVAGAGQPLRRDGAHLGAGARLQDLEQREPHRLLDLRVAGDLHVGAGPEGVEEGPLLGEQLIPSGEPGQRHGGRDLIVHGGPGAGG
jgi:hypothetical protein